MLILAVYYTIADMVLLGQMFYYRGFTWKDEVVPPTPKKKPTRRNGGEVAPSHNGGGGIAPPPDERTRLLGGGGELAFRDRRGSDWSDRLSHLNPANPVVETASPPPPSTALQAAAWNTLCVVMVVAAGVLGWWLSQSSPAASDDDQHHEGKKHHHGGGGSDGEGEIHMDLWGQVFGWLCAVFYLGSRLPQLLLNFRRKSTEGVSMLFFLFACLGNLTYVLSIFAFEPKCAENEDGGGCAPGEAGRIYGRYILVNLSWLAGSAGTLLLDLGIFIQFFVYAEREGDESAILEAGEDGDDETSIDGDRWDQRPILERNQSVESH